MSNLDQQVENRLPEYIYFLSAGNDSEDEFTERIRMSARLIENYTTAHQDVEMPKYSKFKFGCKDSARDFGTTLGSIFVSSLMGRIVRLTAHTLKKKIIVLSSPYEHIPTATAAMKDYFIRYLNTWLIESGLDPVLEVKIYRTCSYHEDYGQMSREERNKLISGDQFHVDASLLKGNINIFLDDAFITGTHEQCIIKMLKNQNIFMDGDTFNFFLYYVAIKNPFVDPKIENELNYAYVKNLLDLDKIIKNEEFILNTRVVKYILNSDPQECQTFLHYQKKSFLYTLYHAAIGNRYHKIPAYTENLNFLKQLI